MANFKENQIVVYVGPEKIPDCILPKKNQTVRLGKDRIYKEIHYWMVEGFRMGLSGQEQLFTDGCFRPLDYSETTIAEIIEKINVINEPLIT